MPLSADPDWAVQPHVGCFVVPSLSVSHTHSDLRPPRLEIEVQSMSKLVRRVHECELDHWFKLVLTSQQWMGTALLELLLAVIVSNSPATIQPIEAACST